MRVSGSDWGSCSSAGFCGGHDDLVHAGALRLLRGFDEGRVGVLPAHGFRPDGYAEPLRPG